MPERTETGGRQLYEDVNSAFGDMENRIKECRPGTAGAIVTPSGKTPALSELEGAFARAAVARPGARAAQV